MKYNYQPKGKLLWDCWFIKVKNIYHVFYLQALPSREPKERHDKRVSIGHAISHDLINWKELSTALEPGEEDSWDNLALWTGSVIEKDGMYYMFYTGRNKDENKMWIQKIGFATSNDLMHWDKYDKNPIMEADHKYYAMDNNKNNLGKVGAWRDPFVFQDSSKYYITITARKKGNNREYNGCVALAESRDLLNWEILKPIFAPDIYDEIETTQIIFHKGYYYLFFSTHAEGYKPNLTNKPHVYGGLYCYYSRDLFGGYKPVNETGVVLGNEDEMYSVRLLHDKENEFISLGWLNNTKKQKFVGKLTMPFKIKIERNKVLTLWIT